MRVRVFTSFDDSFIASAKDEKAAKELVEDWKASAAVAIKEADAIVVIPWHAVTMIRMTL